MKKIALSGKNGKGKYAIVDDEDYALLVNRKWCVGSHGYALRFVNGRELVLMHRLQRSGTQVLWRFCTYELALVKTKDEPFSNPSNRMWFRAGVNCGNLRSAPALSKTGRQNAQNL